MKLRDRDVDVGPGEIITAGVEHCPSSLTPTARRASRASHNPEYRTLRTRNSASAFTRLGTAQGRSRASSERISRNGGKPRKLWQRRSSCQRTSAKTPRKRPSMRRSTRCTARSTKSSVPRTLRKRRSSRTFPIVAASVRMRFAQRFPAAPPRRKACIFTMCASCITSPVGAGASRYQRAFVSVPPPPEGTYLLKSLERDFAQSADRGSKDIAMEQWHEWVAPFLRKQRELGRASLRYLCPGSEHVVLCTASTLRPRARTVQARLLAHRRVRCVAAEPAREPACSLCSIMLPPRARTKPLGSCHISRVHGHYIHRHSRSPPTRAAPEAWRVSVARPCPVFAFSTST